MQPKLGGHFPSETGLGEGGKKEGKNNKEKRQENVHIFLIICPPKPMKLPAVTANLEMVFVM